VTSEKYHYETTHSAADGAAPSAPAFGLPAMFVFTLPLVSAAPVCASGPIIAMRRKCSALNECALNSVRVSLPSPLLLRRANSASARASMSDWNEAKSCTRPADDSKAME
jgi:hypothetical protein